MRKILLLFVFISSLYASQGQQCAIGTNVNGIAGTGFTNGTIAQSFTACKSGLLASVSAQSGNAATGFNEVMVEIFNGDGVGGTKLLTTSAIQVNSNRTVTWSLSSFNLQVVEGQKYTARFTTTSGAPQLKYGTGQNSAIDYYTGGRVYFVGNSWNDMFFSASIQTLSAPTLNPVDDAVEVSRSTEVKMDFTRSMEAVSGNITIENLTDGSTQMVDVSTLTIDAGEVLMPLATPLFPGKEYSIIIPSGVLRATNGIPFGGLSAGDWTFTTSTKPFAVLSTASSELTNDPSIAFNIDFSDVVTGFDLADLVITNGVASNFAGAGASYTFDVAPSVDGAVELLLPGEVVEAGPSNGNEITSYEFVYDGTDPGVVLSTEASGTIQTSIFEIEVIFSEPVSGFETSDLQIVNANVLSSVSTKDSLYTLTLQAIAEGQITVDLDASLVTDLAGNDNTAAPAIIDLDYSVDLGSNLISFYPFNGNANDTVSTGINGTVTGATLTTGFDGTIDGAYSFDGSDQIVFGDTPIGAGSFSLAFWVKIPEGLVVDRSYTILGKRAACTEGRLFEINYRNSSTNGHQISIEQRNNTGVASPVINLASVGEWIHIAYVKDNGESESSFYLDGVQQTPVAWTSTYNFENNGNLRAGISACNGNGRFRFNGSMDDLYVYDRALTAVEVDLLAPIIIKDQSVAAGGGVRAGDAIEYTFNKELITTSINTTTVTASSSTSGTVALAVTTEGNTVRIVPTQGWPLNEEITISLAGILAANGTSFPSTDLSYNVVADEDAGMVLHYPITGNVNEAIGIISAQDGTTSGTLFVPGFDNENFGALSFDGADDLVTLGDAPIGEESFSLSVWLKIPADGSESVNTNIFSKRAACAEGRSFEMMYRRSGDKVRFSTEVRSNTPAGSPITGFDFPVDEWLNVTFVKDNEEKQNRILVNGVLASQVDWPITTVNLENTAAIRLGFSPCVGSTLRRYDGLIDDLRIYDQVIKPRVASISPASGATDLPVDTVISITFDRAIETSSVTGSTINLDDSDGNAYLFTTTFSEGDSVLTITPDNDLPKGKEYTLSVGAIGAVVGSDFLPFQTSFSVVPTQLLSFSPINGAVKIDSLETISFKFDNAVSLSSAESGIQVIGNHQGPVNGVFSLPTPDSLVFTPSVPYFPNEVISVYVTTALQDAGGESAGDGFAFRFHARSVEITSGSPVSFELTQLSASISIPRILIPADVDADGDLDLIGGDEGNRRLYLFENIGSGNYNAGTIIDSNNDPFDIEVTDFDADGDLDILTAVRVTGQGVNLYENDGSGNFTESNIANLAAYDLRSVKAADFNGDGQLEVLTSSVGKDRVSVISSDGTIQAEFTSLDAALTADYADIDGDGDFDIITGHFGTSSAVRLYTNNGDFSFTGTSLHATNGVRKVLPFDIDQDGDIDIIYSAGTDNQIGVLENDGAGSFSNVQVGSVVAPLRFEIGDVDGDGDFDIVYSTNGSGASLSFHYLENAGSLTLWVPRSLLVNDNFQSPYSTRLGDIDNDGDLDVIATDANIGFYVFENKMVDINEAPIVVSAIADQTLEEDATAGLSIDVSGVFVDNDGDAFTLSASSDNAAVRAVVNGNILEVNVITPEFSGTVNITVTADDGNQTNNDVFVLEVTPVNDAPLFDLSVTSITLEEDFDSPEVITITQNQPADEAAPTYSLSPASVSFATVAIDPVSGEVTISSVADGFGTQEFTITADDNGVGNNLATQTFDLTINAVNDAPIVVNPIANISLDEDPSTAVQVGLSTTFADVDNAGLVLSVSAVSGAELADVQLANEIISIIPEANAFGTVEVEVTAEDAEGLQVAEVFDIVINSVNDEPSFTISGDLVLVSDFTTTETVLVTPDPIPFGEENQLVTYSLSPASVAFANVSIDANSGEVTVTAVAEAEGIQEFTITADDGQSTNNLATQIFNLSVEDKQTQSVNFSSLPALTFGDPNFSITADTDSGLPISFSVISGGLAIVESATGTGGGGAAVFAVTDAGPAVIRAANDGDDNYAAFQVDIPVDVAKKDQFITVTPLENKSVVAGPITVMASVDSDLPLSYSVTGPATNNGNVVTLNGTIGTVNVTVSQVGTDNYNAATETVTFEVVEQQLQTISFTALPNEVTYGVSPIVLEATADSGLPVSFTIVSGVATLTDNLLTITQVGTVVIEASQPGNDDFLPVTDVEQTIVVNPAELIFTANDQTITYGEELPAFTYTVSGFVNGETEADANVVANASLAFQFTGDFIPAGEYSISMSATSQVATTNYSFVAEAGTLLVEKATQVISFTEIGNKVVEDAPFDVIASVDSGLDLTYAITGPATISGTTITLDGTLGEVIVTISQGGNDNYVEASEMITFEVVRVLATADAPSLFKIYPNPTTEYLILDGGEISEFSIITLGGAVIMRESSPQEKLDVSDLSEGTYILRVKVDGEFQSVSFRKTN